MRFVLKVTAPAFALAAGAALGQPPRVPAPPDAYESGWPATNDAALGGDYPRVPGEFGPPPAGPLDLGGDPFGPPPGGPASDAAFGPPGARRPGQPFPPPQPFASAPFSPDIQPHRPLSIRDYGWTYIEPPTPREIAVHDIVTILVDEKSELQVQSRFNRQRNASFKAELKEFLRLDDDGNLASAVADGITIDSNLRGRLQSDGTVADREGIRYRIAATVVGVLPNGNLVLEARKTIRSNDGLWEYTLTGTIASRDVKNDFTAVSENIANLQIAKHQKGRIADSTQRPWGMWLYDRLSPF